jgi:tripartite-type tricarboxylate transporter receptor subunit TctC
MRRIGFAGIVAAIALFGAAAEAQTSDYPSRPIEVVVPYGAGGGNDLTARVMSTVASDYLGQPVVIRIRPGGGTIVGLSEVARSKADGYTLAWPGPHAIVISAFDEVPMNFLEDLVPVSQMVDWRWFLVVPADSPFNTLEDLINHAKEQPGGVVMANSGNLAIGHLPALELEALAGVEFTHLPFDGGGPANASILSQDADAVHAVSPAAIPQIQAGVYKALAVTGKGRSSALPDVPTYEELGYAILTGNSAGLVAPAGTPPEVIKKLDEAMQKISEDKTYISLLKKLGDEPAYLNSEDYTASLKGYEETAKGIAEKLRAAGVIQ